MWICNEYKMHQCNSNSNSNFKLYVESIDAKVLTVVHINRY